MEGFRYGKYCVVVCDCFPSSGLDEAVPIFLALIEVCNMVDRSVPKYGLYLRVVYIGLVCVCL